MTKEEMWEEFESQLKREVRTPMTMSYDDSIRLAEMGIEVVVKRWKKRFEQESILDKIRAEIEQRCCITVGRENDPAITLHDVFQIIDKYKAEVRDKECI